MPGTFDRPYLILCEGESDKKLFDRLIDSQVNSKEFQVEFVGGRSHFGEKLKIYFETSETFLDNIKAILIISDKDDDSDCSFREVQIELQKAAFPVPNAPMEIAMKDSYPKVAIMMVPIRGNGNIETLCLLAARDQWGLEQEIDEFISKSPAKDWGLSKTSKSKLEIYLAVTCKQSPDTTFARHWHLSEEYHLNTNHYCFEEYVQFIINFPEFVIRGKLPAALAPEAG